MFYLVVTGNKDMQGNKLNLLYEECRLIFSCFSAERSPRKTHLEAVLPFAIRLIFIRTGLRPLLSISLLGRGQNKILLRWISLSFCWCTLIKSALVLPAFLYYYWFRLKYLSNLIQLKSTGKIVIIILFKETL